MFLDSHDYFSQYLMSCISNGYAFRRGQAYISEGKKRVNLELSTPLELIGRSTEFQRIVEVLAEDGDLLIAGVPGSGRRTLVRRAALAVGAIILEIDCIRATDGERFVQLMAEAIAQNFDAVKIQDWVASSGKEFFRFQIEENSSIPTSKLIPMRSLNPKQLWQAFELLLKLPQILAESQNQRVVIILQSFPHIRSWDRHSLWEATFRREINQQTHVNYVLIATIAETTHYSEETNYPLETIQLAPLARDVVALWAREILQTVGLTFDSRSKAMQLFLDAVQGHIGDAVAIIRRLQALRRPDGLITEQEVQLAIEELLKDLSITFESLLMLLPGNQVHLLECLATDPTEKPQSREYIQKHGLSRGGSLQGALTGLQHKGLIYGAEQRYQMALPLLALWLRQRLG
ncbi:ATP-binding protein [Fischerella thermalis CCMEE 5268]|uniref:ATP-binding protein n=1 Tax=Fischerella thermalis CCMEE 5268 TaxID=2019662 RepID=A0A2N6KAQ3_9CYAN|nr:ATP-binding protein [Fischerella thermalis CCMEE 5268]PMB48056.1 ATP-binding protein [Fischerella thermalis CCMEE 5205]